jgi:Ulp1 family protease
LPSLVEKQVKEEEIDALYFPIHINRNHWIPCEIDLQKNTVSYGMSMMMCVSR